MVKVVYLKKLQRAPRGAFVIEVVSDRSTESVESGPKGSKMRVKQSSINDVLASMLKKFDGSAVTAIYVRGAKKGAE